MTNISDEKLVEQYLTGDEEALEFLIRRYLKPIYSFVYRNIGDGEVAEDITQETFVKMWKNLKRFDQQKSFKTWLFTIAKNSSIDFLRKKKVTPLSFAEELIAEKGDMVENIAQKDILEAFNIASKKLSSKNQKLIALHHQSGLTFSEIAQFLGEPINTIKSRYRRAITTLKKMLVDFQ